MHLVVTITYNPLSHDILPAFLSCVEAQNNQDFVLLIIDNASHDGTQDFLRSIKLPNVQLLLNNENVGFGRACNQGIAAAQKIGATYITFINNDVEFDGNLFQKMVQSLKSSDAVGLSPLITFYDRPDRLWFGTGTFRWSRGMVPYHDSIGSDRRRIAKRLKALEVTDFATGCCLIFKTSVFNEIPGFDDRFFVYWEDADLSLTLKKRGLKIVTDTKLELRHKVSVSTGGSFSDFSVYHFNRGHMLFMQKHFGSFALSFAVSMSFIKACLNVIRGRMKINQLKVWWRSVASAF